MGSTVGAARSAGSDRAGLARRAVLLFARPPAQEAAAKGLSRATPLFRLALQRVRRAAAATGARLVVVGDGWAPAAETVGPVLRQRGRGFGERFANAFADVLRLGFDEVVSVGIDAPGLTESHVAAAFKALGSAPLVLGPAADGGAYLIGCTRDPRRLFRTVRWCSGNVLGDLRHGCPAAAVLPETLNDVDHAHDLRRLAAVARHDTVLARALALATTAASPLGTDTFAVPHLSALLVSSLSRRGPPTPCPR